VRLGSVELRFVLISGLPSFQMVRLIENTVKGLLQLPPAAEATPAADLLRRILVPNPKNRWVSLLITRTRNNARTSLLSSFTMNY